MELEQDLFELVNDFVKYIKNLKEEEFLNQGEYEHMTNCKLELLNNRMLVK